MPKEEKNEETTPEAKRDETKAPQAEQPAKAKPRPAKLQSAAPKTVTNSFNTANDHEKRIVALEQRVAGLEAKKK